MKQGDCFRCGAKVMVEKVGEWPNGKAKWKTYELDATTVHPHSPIKDDNTKPGSAGNITAAGAGIEQWAAIGTMLETLNDKLDKILVIITNGEYRPNDFKFKQEQ